VPGPQPDVRNFGWRDYGLRVGIWRIFDYDGRTEAADVPSAKRLGVRGDAANSGAHSPTAAMRWSATAIRNSERQSDMDATTEADMIAHATKTLADSCGRRPYGWMGRGFPKRP